MKTSDQPTPATTTTTQLLVTTPEGHRAVSPLPPETPARLHPRHLLVPTDFSPASKKALAYADAFASTFGSRITLIHVIEPMVLPPEYGYLPHYSPEDEARQVEAVHRQLLDIAVGLDTAKRTEFSVRVGRPWHEVVGAVGELGIDLLVLTTHGRTGLRHMLMGSVAEKIVRHTHCPVLVVRPEETDFLG
ncbi:MAG: universal stress protein [Verrucomicrobia bacterium]|nr:universal stress protein [Verrucomicrobiota bacterium]